MPERHSRASQDLVKHFPLTAGVVLRRTVGAGQGRRRRRASTCTRARRSASSASPAAASRPWRRLLMRLEKPTAGKVHLRGRGHGAARPGGELRRHAPRHPDGLPGPVHLAEPPDDGRRHHRRAVRDPPRRRAQGRPPQAGPGAARPGRAQPRAHQPLPAPVLRRPAAAHRHRPRHSPCNPEVHRLRRAGLRARRVGPGAGRQPAGEAAGRARPGLHLHRPRPVGRAAHLRPGRRSCTSGKMVELGDGGRGLRPARRTRTPRRCCRPCRCPTRRCAASATQIVLAGRRPLAGQPAVGLPVPHPVLEGAGRSASQEEPLLEMRADGAGEHLSACHFAEPRTIVETVDVVGHRAGLPVRRHRPARRRPRRRRPGRPRPDGRAVGSAATTTRAAPPRTRPG